MKYIFDFDDVLFNNTEQFKPHIFKVLAGVGIPEEEAKAFYYRPEVHEQEFSLMSFMKTLFLRFGVDVMLLESKYEEIMKPSILFLNTELIEQIKKIGVENCHIVTNGEKEFNKDKLKYTGIWDMFGKERIHIVPGEKTEVIQNICAQDRDSLYTFVDDKTKFLDEPGLLDIPNLKRIQFKKGEKLTLLSDGENENPEKIKLR